MELSLFGPDLGDVDVEEADRVHTAPGDSWDHRRRGGRTPLSASHPARRE
jgi:hypothetical protein